MKIRIKTKLYLGLIPLFVIVVLTIVVGIYSINRLANDSKAIIKANYESLQFAKNMQESLDNFQTNDSSALLKFEKNLASQELNITEVGENEVTLELRNQFEQLKHSEKSVLKINDMRSLIYRMMELNLNAIERKSNEAEQTAYKAKLYLAVIGTFSFLIALSFLLNFPGYIADPITRLTEGIKEITNKNYSKRIYLKSGDEFGELANAFNAMAERLDAYENSNLAKIIFEKRRIDTIINNMKDPIVGFDEHRNVLFANSEAIKILGIQEKELIGKYGPDVALKNDLFRNLITEEAGIKPLKIYSDNKESYFSKEVYKIVSDENPIGEVIMLRNITKFKELDQAKTNFIATISHELKTPISSIKMSLKLLEDERIGKVNDEQRKMIEHIKDDAQRLLKISGELLDLAQVESGNIQLRKETVNPESIVEYSCNALRVQAEQKQIDIDIKYGNKIPNVICDLEKTAWIMVNFLSNAIRFSPEKSTIYIEVTGDPKMVTFSVRDSGKGIEQKYKDRIFEKFYQIPSDMARTGSGLGLAISKDFIIAQGGNIWVESKINEGSTFAFSLPAAV